MHSGDSGHVSRVHPLVIREILFLRADKRLFARVSRLLARDATGLSGLYTASPTGHRVQGGGYYTLAAWYRCTHRTGVGR